MKRTVHPEARLPIDYDRLIRALEFLDGALRRGVVVGIFEGSMQVSDEDIAKALVRVNGLRHETAQQIEALVRSMNRAQSGSLTLQ